jgi:hypothetical protein
MLWMVFGLSVIAVSVLANSLRHTAVPNLSDGYGSSATEPGVSQYVVIHSLLITG